MFEYGTCCGCLSLRKECIVFGLVDLITQIPHIAVDVGADGDIAFMDLIFVLLGTLLSSVLVCGAILRNLFCLWLWIIVHIIRTVLFGVGLIYCVIALLTGAKSHTIPIEVQEELSGLELEILISLVSIHIAIYIYVIVMVYRYIRQLNDEEFEECDDDCLDCAEEFSTRGAKEAAI